jgi:hypothetical protein
VNTWSRIVRAVAEPALVYRVLSGRAQGAIRRRFGLAVPIATEDRRVLEQVIFAHYRNDPRIKNVLFVGCDSYTAHYQRRYFPEHNYWTMDPEAQRRKFGGNNHILGRLEDLGRHVPCGYFHLILCNGVYGWGLNSLQDCESAVSQCYLCLADGGHLLIGWNDVPLHDPAPLSEVRSFELFSKHPFSAFGAWKYLTATANRHTYHFYRKTK